MAVIGIFTEPTGRTRVLFDFRVPAEDDEQRIAIAMEQSRPTSVADGSEIVVEPQEVRRAKRMVPAFR